MFPLQNCKVVNVLKQASTATNASATGVVDTLGFDEVQVHVFVDTAASTSNIMTTMKLQECDTSNGTFTDIVALTGATATSTSAGQILPTIADTSVGDVHVLTCSMRGRKRWVKPIVTPTTAAIIIGLTAVLGKSEDSSVAQAGHTGSGVSWNG